MSNDMQTSEMSGNELEQYFADLKAPEIQDPAAVEEEILRGILAAQTPEEALRGGKLTSARDVIGVPLTIRGVRYNRSSFETREAAYAVIDAVDRRTGEVLTIGCGARKVMAQLWVFDQRGWLPAELIISESANQTANGYRVMQLEPVETAF